MAEPGIDMKRRMKLYAKWNSHGDVEWQVYGLSGWSLRGGFGNCVSKRCLMERVHRIVRAPKQPPKRIYEMADSVLGYFFGMVSDFGEQLRSYRVSVGLDIGAADSYDRALVDVILTKLTGRRQKHSESGRFPELYLRARLTYAVYDCPGTNEPCEGWWAEVAAEYLLPGEWCVVEWWHYMGSSVDSVNRDAIRRAAYKALKHAYNTPVRL